MVKKKFIEIKDKNGNFPVLLLETENEEEYRSIADGQRFDGNELNWSGKSFSTLEKALKEVRKHSQNKQLLLKGKPSSRSKERIDHYFVW